MRSRAISSGKPWRLNAMDTPNPLTSNQIHTHED
jgi:hypothetical protein